MKPLDGKVAIVTGASRGIGLAIARKLVRMGGRIAICARDAARLNGAAAELRGEGATVLAVPADVSRAQDVADLVQKAEAKLGPIEILINNAGIGFFGPTHEASEANWDTVLDTNLKSVFLMSKAVARGMIERRGGHIINISSLAGKNPLRNGAAYAASKWGLNGLSYSVAEELRGHNVRVSVVCPGSVNTELSPHAGKDVGKMLQPEDVAHAVAMLVTQAPQSFVSEVLIRPTQKP